MINENDVETLAGSVTRSPQKGRGRFDLLPPNALLAMAWQLENGAISNGERNWEQGMPLSASLNSALRHLTKALAGMTDEDHLTAALTNLAMAVETRARVKLKMLPPELLEGLPRGSYCPESIGDGDQTSPSS